MTSTELHAKAVAFWDQAIQAEARGERAYPFYRASNDARMEAFEAQANEIAATCRECVRAMA